MNLKRKITFTKSNKYNFKFHMIVGKLFICIFAISLFFHLLNVTWCILVSLYLSVKIDRQICIHTLLPLQQAMVSVLPDTKSSRDSCGLSLNFKGRDSTVPTVFGCSLCIPALCIKYHNFFVSNSTLGSLLLFFVTFHLSGLWDFLQKKSHQLLGETFNSLNEFRYVMSLGQQRISAQTFPLYKLFSLKTSVLQNWNQPNCFNPVIILSFPLEGISLRLKLVPVKIYRFFVLLQALCSTSNVHLCLSQLPLFFPGGMCTYLQPLLPFGEGSLPTNWVAFLWRCPVKTSSVSSTTSQSVKKSRST